MAFFVMCIQWQAHMWGAASAVMETWAQMMTPYSYRPRATVSVTAEVGDASLEIKLENRKEMRRALRDFRRQVDDIWPEDVVKGDK